MKDNISLEAFMELIKDYQKEDIDKITKAYRLAEGLHSGQFRQSGEPYIMHPLNVAYILAELNADCDTICAGLLHDTLEDTKVTKEEIAQEFNSTVANLVDGVTKISKLNFSNKQEQNMANTRKIITGICEDVRIIIIKLCDRLHNMRTLQFKSEIKQKENSLETMDIFVPLAYYIGAYRIKSELEDLSLQYLEPNIYQEIKERKEKAEDESRECLNDMADNIKNKLEEKNIPNNIKIRTKNVYGIYKRLELESIKSMRDIHDLHSLKIMVDEIPNCYISLGCVHSLYNPINDKFKDYIYNPKTNMYQSLHTTVFGPDDRLVQTQIRTFDMDLVASFGLTSYWNIKQGDARDTMQENLKTKFQFYKSLIEMDRMFGDNQEFVRQVKEELFSDKIYVYDSSGNVIELPKGSTPIDFAYKLSTDIGNTMAYAIVNNEYVPINFELKNKDRVKIVTDELTFGPKEEWLDSVKTTHARRKIQEFWRR